jgi:hypothetical protein
MTTTPAPGEPGNQTLLDAVYWARRDPEWVRALIAKTEGWTWREAEANPEIAADLIRQLAAALSASLPREDADLDALLRRMAEEHSAGQDAVRSLTSKLDGHTAPERQKIHDALDELHLGHLALLARVRTAEAERDEAQRRLGVIADSAQDGLADSDDDHDMSALWVLTVATGQDEADTEPSAALASRTVETAEEWEALPIGAIVRTAGGSVVTRYDADTGTLFGDASGYPWRRLHGGSTGTGWKLPATILWQPVPPSPEEADQ